MAIRLETVAPRHRPSPFDRDGDWVPTAQRPEMADQRTLVRGERAPLGSTKEKEGAMSAVVGIDVGEYKHAAAVCRSGEREAERAVFRLSANRAGFDGLERWLERQGPVERALLLAACQPPSPGWLPGGGCKSAAGQILCEEPGCSGASRTRPMLAHWRRWV